MTTFFHHEQQYRDLSTIADRLITICGAGSLGTNLAETLARMGLRNVRVIDRDRIEPHNLATQPWGSQDVGAQKAKVLATLLYRAVGAKLDAHAVELTPTNANKLLKESAVVVDCFDNIPSRRLVAETATKFKIPCLHLALGGEGDYGCGLWDDAYTLPEQPTGVDGCDYPLTQPLALLVVAAGAEALVSTLLTQHQRGFEVTLRDLTLRTV